MAFQCLLLLGASFVFQPASAEADITHRQYKILSSTQIAGELVNLAADYPRLATLTTAQEEFNLPYAGTNHDCMFAPNLPGCPNFILLIHDPIANPPGSYIDASLPEVFLSGALHGNERVGPTAVLETAKLLLEAAYCESLPQFVTPPDVNTEQGAEWLLQEQEGESCRNKLLDGGITNLQRKWLARLVATRRIIIVPMTNALGYDRNERTEDGIDPNRDFPYDVESPDKCMQTIAGRTVNELFQRHLFQISLTFHAGTEVVGYEWGAFPYLPTNLSPDDLAQIEIGGAYSRFAGGFQGTDSYKSGTMNELVYAVRGGMEDWAYAGSWDTELMAPCEPTNYGGYPKSKTRYNESTLRAFNMLIETSNDKIPHNHFGSSQGILGHELSYEQNGHVARNIRLSLSAIEFVQPYVSIWGANMTPLQNDVVPLMPRSGSICKDSKVMKIPQNQKGTKIGWTVGGGFDVDYTTIMYAKWEDVPEVMDCAHQPLPSELGVAFRTAVAVSGPTIWKVGWQDNAFALNDGHPMFFASIDTSMFQPGDTIAVFASARLDQGWSKVPDGAKPNIAPQSHVVNARTNPEWRHESAGKIIQGRQDWYSIPLTLVISDESDDPTTVELSDRFTYYNLISRDSAQTDKAGNTDQDDDENDDEEDEEIDRTAPHDSGQGSYNDPYAPDKEKMPLPNLLLIVVLSGFCVFLVYRLGKWISRKRSGRERVNILDDDDVFVNEFTFDEDIQLRELA